MVLQFAGDVKIGIEDTSSPGPKKKKGIFFSFFPGSQCVPTMFHSSSQYVPRHVLHSTPTFIPYALANVLCSFHLHRWGQGGRTLYFKIEPGVNKMVKVLKSIPDQVWYILHTIVNCFRHNLKLELVALFFQEIYIFKKNTGSFCIYFPNEPLYKNIYTHFGKIYTTFHHISS